MTCISCEPIFPEVFEGIDRLGYRGKDMTGIAAMYEDGSVIRWETIGAASELDDSIVDEAGDALNVVSHGRWATTGSRDNIAEVHPFTVGNGTVVLNGVIENYKELRGELKARGRRFETEGDTEVLAALFDEEIASGRTALEGVRSIMGMIVGENSFVALSALEPEKQIVARVGSDMFVGRGSVRGKLAHFATSDAAALTGMVDDFARLEDGQIAELTTDSLLVTDLIGRVIEPQFIPHTMSLDELGKGEYRSFLEKEIAEQAGVVRKQNAQRAMGKSGLTMPEIAMSETEVQRIKEIVQVACGTSMRASKLMELYYEDILGVRAATFTASEFQRRPRILGEDVLGIAMSQSGTTTDTNDAVKRLLEKDVYVHAFVNRISSELEHIAHSTTALMAGVEISVASTKAFTAQVVAGLYFAMNLARMRGVDESIITEINDSLQKLPEDIERAMEIGKRVVPSIAEYLSGFDSVLMVGSAEYASIADETTLKMSEVDKINVRFEESGEMKHGPLGLVDESFPTVGFVPSGDMYRTVQADLDKIRTSNGPLIVIHDEAVSPGEAMFSIPVPEATKWTGPILANVIGQMIAEHVGEHRVYAHNRDSRENRDRLIEEGEYEPGDYSGLNERDIDLPPNLAKSVTTR